MNTKLLMISSAFLLGGSGMFLQFMPHEVLNSFGTLTSGINPLLVQIIGALFLGFAMMNWMAKTVLIGGIYARPLAMGNFVHFMVGGLALLKFTFLVPNSIVFWGLTVIYSIFAFCFGFVFFTNPSRKNEKDADKG